MRFLRDNPEYWHRRAEEVRVIAEITTDPEACRILFAIAEGYDRLAKAPRSAEAATKYGA